MKEQEKENEILSNTTNIMSPRSTPPLDPDLIKKFTS